MSICPLTAAAEIPVEKEDDLQREGKSLESSPTTSLEEARRDRLAHLLLLGLKVVKARGR